MAVHTKCELVEKEKLKDDIFKLSVKSKEIKMLIKFLYKK